ncbi:MAG: SDR family NAD(P)-dependent oxidoreductase [Saprospiraceae bacterium]
MNRIILAYSPENAALANSIDQQLSRIGIPFEHANAAVASQIASADEPVLLLVTDNFLINRACLEGLLPVLQGLAAENRLVAVLADGNTADGKIVPTHLDRMANALHYMKYWQDTWLALSDVHQHLVGEKKAALTAELDATRSVANEMGDIISTLRDAGYLTMEQFKANDFEAFFQKFNLVDWHGQYKRLVAQELENDAIVAAPLLPEMPVVGGLLTPEPIQEATLPKIDPNPEEDVPQLEAKDTLLQEMEMETAIEADGLLAGENEETVLAEKQAARDAWFWIEKGHVERGLDLFQLSLEQFPDSEWLKTEYVKAAQHTGLPKVEAGLSEHPNTQTPGFHSPTDEAKSYELMGDMAAERGDYLFAKYCWDRVVELDPGTPNIFRKLGLMTAEHLRDYRETAAIYLHKALEMNENDQEVKIALEAFDETASFAKASAPEAATIDSGSISGQNMHETEDQKTKELDISSQQELEAIKNQQSTTIEPLPAITPLGENQQSKLVLITGAGSGIGRATAEIFARNGYRLILTGRRVERLVDLKSRFEAEFGTEILILPFDVRDPGAVEAALGNLPESFQDIDILVNNAGLAKGLASIHEGNLEHWETMIDTNVKGLLYVTRLISPGMVSRRSGHIINVGSSAGKEAYPKGNVYCATKFAVDALTKSMRFDLHEHNIRVSQVSPGHVEETEFAITRFDGDAERAKIYNDFQPLKSSDVADAIYYMATRPPHVNIQDIQLFATQQASSMVIDRSGR